MAKMLDVGKKAKKRIKKLVGKEPLSVISVSKEGKNWKAVVEVLERKSVPDTENILGEYEVTLDPNLKLLGYERIRIRKKRETFEKEEEVVEEE